MKATLTEYDNGFFFEFVPEDDKDVIKLVRFGMNATKERLFFSTHILQGSTYTQLSISKRKMPFSMIKGK